MAGSFRHSPHVGGSVATRDELKKKYTDGKLSLSPNAKRYIRMVLGGIDPADAARLLGYGHSTGSRIYHSIIGQEYIASIEGRLDDDMVAQAVEDAKKPMEDRVRRILEEESVVTLQTLIGLRNSEDEKISLAASRDILDRAGITAKTEVKNVVEVEGTPGLMAALAAFKELDGIPNLVQPAPPAKESKEEDVEAK